MNGASNVTWNEASPPDTALVGNGDDNLRSVKTSIASGLNDEHNWPLGGGSAVGYHRYGSARPYYGTQSRVSSTATDGRLMVTSDTSRLFGVGSVGTVLLGGPRILSLASFPGGTAPQRHHWAVELGQSTMSVNNGASTGSVEITFPSSYSGEPIVLLSFANLPSAWFGLSASSVTAGGMIAVVKLTSASVATVGSPIHWLSLGTRVL